MNPKLELDVGFWTFWLQHKLSESGSETVAPCVSSSKLPRWIAEQELILKGLESSITRSFQQALNSRRALLRSISKERYRWNKFKRNQWKWDRLEERYGDGYEQAVEQARKKRREEKLGDLNSGVQDALQGNARAWLRGGYGSGSSSEFDGSESAKE